MDRPFRVWVQVGDKQRLPRGSAEAGGRDHTTVIHATSKIARLIREDRSVYNLVQELTARVRQLR
jgi:chromosomal replication initiator protein